MRLNLDFKLDTTQERLDYLTDYIQDKKFTDANLEMMANYLLWSVDDPDFEVDSNNSPWKTRESKHISWQTLQEEELEGNRKSVYQQISEIQEKGKKRKLDRNCVLTKLKYTLPSATIEAILSDPSAPIPQFEEQLDSLTITWFDLWGQIDQTEYKVQYWELKNGKRRADLPIRQELFERLAFFALYSKYSGSFNQFIAALEKTAESWDGYTALKQKRQLVALRTEQYTLLDSLQGESLQKHGNIGLYWNDMDNGLRGFKPFMAKELLFDKFQTSFFNRDYQDICIKELQNADAPLDFKEIDLRDPDTVRAVLFARKDLYDSLPELTYQDYEIVSRLLEYIDFYIKQCNFSPELEYILFSKINGSTNRKISEYLKDKFNLDYKENYISTIFTKRIINSIVKEVEKHYKNVEYILMGKNVFKRCSCCGKLLPRNSEFFNKRATSNDGFFNYCKACKIEKKTQKEDKQ